MAGQMIRKACCLVLLIALSGCATLKPSQGPATRLDQVHLGGATAIAFSPDGKRLASGGHNGTVSVWGVPQGEPEVRARPHRRAVRGVAWPDQQTVLSAAEDGRVVLWNATTGQALRRVQTVPVTAMAYDPREDFLVTGHEDGTVRVFAGHDLRERDRAAIGAGIAAVAYHPETRRLAVATDTNEVLLMDQSLQILQRLPSPRDALGLRFSPDGRYLAGGAWFQLLVWDLHTGRLDVRETEHFGAIIAMDFTPDGEELVTIGRHTDGGIRVVDADDNHVVRRLLAHDACGWSVRVSPNGRYVATASEDESIRFYDLQAPYEPRFDHEP